MGLSATVRSELDDLTAQLRRVSDSIGRTGDDLQIDARSLHESGADNDAVSSIARRLDDQGAQLRRLQAKMTRILDTLG